MDQNSVSVILINWNHLTYLPDCLGALKAQEYPDLEITIVDNGSADGSVDWIQRHYPDVNLIAFPDNRGFAPAFNLAARETSAEFLLSLNPDVTVQPGFISELVNAIQEEGRIGIAAPKLLMADQPERIDTTGLFISRARQAVRPRPGRNRSGPVRPSNRGFRRLRRGRTLPPEDVG